MPLTVGINHVTTTTTDLDRLVRFYAEAFGAEKVFERAESDGYPRMAIIYVGGSRYVKVVEDDAAGAARSGARAATEQFALAVDSYSDLRQLRERMMTAGVDVGEIERIPTQWVLPFTDPDGTPLQVCAHAQPGDGA
jgi:predicted enzyme related to lactoylglutathione lyase